MQSLFIKNQWNCLNSAVSANIAGKDWGIPGIGIADVVVGSDGTHFPTPEGIGHTIAVLQSADGRIIAIMDQGRRIPPARSVKALVGNQIISVNTQEEIPRGVILNLQDFQSSFGIERTLVRIAEKFNNDTPESDLLLMQEQLNTLTRSPAGQWSPNREKIANYLDLVKTQIEINQLNKELSDFNARFAQAVNKHNAANGNPVSNGDEEARQDLKKLASDIRIKLRQLIDHFPKNLLEIKYVILKDLNELMQLSERHSNQTANGGISILANIQTDIAAQVTFFERRMKEAAENQDSNPEDRFKELEELQKDAESLLARLQKDLPPLLQATRIQDATTQQRLTADNLLAALTQFAQKTNPTQIKKIIDFTEYRTLMNAYNKAGLSRSPQAEKTAQIAAIGTQVNKLLKREKIHPQITEFLKTHKVDAPTKRILEDPRLDPEIEGFTNKLAKLIKDYLDNGQAAADFNDNKNVGGIDLSRLTIEFSVREHTPILGEIPLPDTGSMPFNGLVPKIDAITPATAIPGIGSMNQ